MFMAAIFIFMVICLLFQGLMPWFSKTNIFGTAAEKERGRLVYVLMCGQKHFNKLFEAKLFVNFFNFFYWLDVLAMVMCFTFNIK